MKQTVQEAAKEMCEAWGMEDNHGYGVKDTFQVGFAQGAQWQAKQSPWISVEERLPDNNNDLYIVLDTNLDPPACGVCDFDPNINKWVGAGGIIAHPTHWMPIPALSKGGEE